jgi:hypothetical protein
MSEKTVNGASVSMKKKGDPLSHTEFNSVVDALNSFVPVINNSLRSYCNVNITNSIDTAMTLQEAIREIHKSKRALGMRIKFLCSETGDWEVYDYSGTSLGDWENPENWTYADQVDEVDGGEF